MMSAKPSGPDEPRNADPHLNSPVYNAGAPLEQAAGAVILLHGRGASAGDILNLAQVFYHPRLAYIAPEASGHTWYPRSFMAPRHSNEPYVTSAMHKIKATLDTLAGAGLSLDKVVICGFSQGACLSTEYVATHPARYGGLIAYTGGLIGPAGIRFDYPGDLAGTPTFLGSGDPDPHVPWSRVEESAAALEQMGASVRVERYAGRPHTINPQELAIGRDIVLSLVD